MTTAGSAQAVGAGGRTPERGRRARELAPIALVDLLDRLLGSGVVVAGDVIVSLAGVDLVEVRLHLLVSTVRAETAPSGEVAR